MFIFIASIVCGRYFLYKSSHYDALYASIVPIALVLLGVLIVYYDIKMREKGKQAILKKKNAIKQK